MTPEFQSRSQSRALPPRDKSRRPRSITAPAEAAGQAITLSITAITRTRNHAPGGLLETPGRRDGAEIGLFRAMENRRNTWTSTTPTMRSGSLAYSCPTAGTRFGTTASRSSHGNRRESQDSHSSLATKRSPVLSLRSWQHVKNECPADMRGVSVPDVLSRRHQARATPHVHPDRLAEGLAATTPDRATVPVLEGGEEMTPNQPQPISRALCGNDAHARDVVNDVAERKVT